MRIVLISDTHTKHDQLVLPAGDMLVHCGDYSWTGRRMEHQDFAIWFDQQPHKYKLIISGNHDFHEELLLESLIHCKSEIHYLLHEPIVINGLKIFGSPYTPPFYNWHFMLIESELIRVYKEIPDNTELLITHGPPHSILDRTQDGEYAGSIALYDRIKELKHLKCHAFGHIHEGYGRETIAGIEFINCSAANGRYKIVNAPMVIDL